MTTQWDSRSKDRPSNKKRELVVANWETLNTLPDGKGGRVRITSNQASATATTYSSATDMFGGRKYKGKDTGGGGGSKVPPDAKLPDPILTPNERYKWNLPPHKWSLPITPGSVNSTTSSSLDAEALTHSTRRGRIFYCAGYTGTEVKASANEAGKLTTGAKKPPSSLYGFHFLWNPETFTQSTRVNMDLTYDSSDPYAALTSLVAANATVSFSLRLDRTNDFACFKDTKRFNDSQAAENVADEVNTRSKKTPPVFSGGKGLAYLSEYYTVGQPIESKSDFQKNMQPKIEQLMKKGTMADLEYLFRAINGDGFEVLGESTSNIGYLMPTIVRLDLGPQKWVGILADISVTHLAFTQDMIPIRTDVMLTLDVRATTKQLSTSSLTTPTNTATTDTKKTS